MDLDEALRSYEESERSLKRICLSIEEENHQLEEEYQQLEQTRKDLLQQFNLLRRNLSQIEQQQKRPFQLK